MTRTRTAAIAAALAAAAALPVLADHTPNGAIEPTADEQVGIYELNRARNDPAAYGEEIGLDLGGVPARPPLAVNRNLTGSAHFHAQLMLDHHEYGHTSDLLGIGGNQMAVDNGYDLFGNGLGYSWGTTNSIESIMRSVNQVATTTAAVKTFIIDKDVPGAGHRVHLLAIGAFGNHREIGFGWAAGTDSFPEFGLPKALPTKLCTIHTAYSNPSTVFLTGVVFNDANRNGRYDRGEGIGGATVAVEGQGSTTSMAAGGWSLAVTPGNLFVTCSGGAFAGTARTLVSVGADNVEVDFRSGRGAAEVDFNWRNGAPQGPTVTATAAPPSGVSPLIVNFTGSGLESEEYYWDFANGDDDTGTNASTTFLDPGLFPVVVTGYDGNGSGRALALVAASDPGFPGEGLSAPTDGALHITKGLLKRVLKAAGKDQAKLTGTLELPGGFSPAGQEVQVCIAGAARTFTLDARGRGVLPDKSRIVLKAKWPKDGSGIAAGTVAKVSVTIKGDLSEALDAGGLRDRTETRTVTGVPAAVFFAGNPWTSSGSMAVVSVEGKTGKGTLLPE